MIWPHATTQHPCPICGRPDWCTFGDKAMLCQRVESIHAHTKGGWFHFYESAMPEYVPRQTAQPPKSIDAYGMIQNWAWMTTDLMVIKLSRDLGVSASSLRDLGVAWCQEKNAWAFPMKDADENIIGIRLRNSQGFKWAVPGSRGGLFIYVHSPPICWPRVFIPEGPTSTAALITLGFQVIGRPSANSGFDLLKDSLKRFHWIREVIIVADNESDKKKMGVKDKWIGIDAAQKLKAYLGMRSCIWIPPTPCKDARDFLKAGGTKAMIEQDLHDKIWTRK